MDNNWRDLFSENIRDFGGYSIGKIFKYLNNPEIISLAGGLPSPDMFLIEETRAAAARRLQDDIRTIMQYTSIPGEKTLIEAVIDFLARDNIQVAPENIVITSSGQHGLDLAGRLFLNPGDVLLLDRPTFAGAIVAFQMQRPEICGIYLEGDGQDIAAYHEMLLYYQKKKVKPKFIYVVPDFQNPSGITTSLSKRMELLELSYRFDVPILEDSPYRDLRYHGETIPSLYSLDQQNGKANVIGLYTFSKIFCPGIRVGFNIGPPEVIQRMTNIKEANVLNTPKLNQDLCTEFLTNMGYDGHMARCRDYYRAKLDLFLDAMQKAFPAASGVTWTKPEGGLFLWVTVPDYIDTNELFLEAIKYKVAFVPGDVFYAENPARNHMRVNFSFTDKDLLSEAVSRLAACLGSKLKG